MALTAYQRVRFDRILSDIHAEVAPAKMSATDAVEFYEDLIEDLQAHANALRDQEDM